MVNKSEIDHFRNGGKNSYLETVVIINCALNALLIPICIIGNTLLLAAILRTPSLPLCSYAAWLYQTFLLD